MAPEDTIARGRAFERMEREHGFFDARFDGWSPWRVMRNALHRRTLALPIASPNRGSAGRVAQALLETVRFAWVLLTARRRHVLLKTSRSGLRMQLGQNFRDVYFDGLLQRGVSYFKIEENNSDAFAEQARRALFRNDLNPVLFTFWGTVLGRLFPVDAMPFCRNVADILQRECALSVAPDWLLLRISTVHWQARLYRALLARLKPDAVMVADTGEYGLRLAAARGGVRFIELQHGIFDASHPDAIPDWVSGSTEELLLPDILACRGDYWIGQLQQTRQGREAAQAVGNEMIDAARLRQAHRPGGGPFRIVVSSQGLDSLNLMTWLRAMAESAPSGLDWSMAIKLHPVYDAHTTAFSAFEAFPNVTVISGSAAPNVFDLLADADLHLSIASACHFDAAALGVPSVVIPLEGHEAMLPAVAEGALLLAASPQRVWNLLETARNHAVDPHQFSTPGFVDSLAALILPQPATLTEGKPYQ